VRRLLTLIALAAAVPAAAFGLFAALDDDRVSRPNPPPAVEFEYYVDETYADARCGMPPYKPCSADRQHEFAQGQQRG
jgi:hypothetical protein